MQIRRGEIWRVNLDPTVGAEIRKTRPVVVVSSDAVGVTKPSAVDTLQLRGVDTQRFVERVGSISPTIMQSIVAAIANVVEYEPE